MVTKIMCIWCINKKYAHYSRLAVSYHGQAMNHITHILSDRSIELGQ